MPHNRPGAGRPRDMEDAVDGLAHRPLARPACRAGLLRKCGAITRHSRIGQIGLVSGYNAAMLSSNSRRPHGKAKLIQEPPGSTADASDTTLFQELPFSRTASGWSGNSTALRACAKKLDRWSLGFVDLLQSQYGIDRIFSRTCDVKQQKASHNTEVFVEALHAVDFIHTCHCPIAMRNERTSQRV
jgi:hypothetical protein